MLEIKLLSLLIGSLGIQALAASSWLRWQQVVVAQQHEEEEELLTPYESKDTQSAAEAQPNGSATAPKDPRLTGWEFKIVRATRDLFRDPRVFKRLCEEEAQAGWILLEKLDDRRARFKRPIALRDIIKSEYLPHDPYRTHYGPSADWKTLLTALAFLISLILPAYLGYALVSRTLASRIPEAASPEPSPAQSAPPASASPTSQPDLSPQN